MNGHVSVKTVYGRDRKTGKKVMPLRKSLGLQGHQPMSPNLEDYLCYLAVRTTSFKSAEEVARKSGIPADDSQIQGLVQRIGERASARTDERVSAAFDRRASKEISREAESELKGERFSMVLMLDGTMLRSRGGDWGMKPAEASGERVVWHELKAGLVIHMPELEDGKRRELRKWYVAWDGGPEIIGRRLYAEALRRGLEQAQRVYVIADGAVWIWKLFEEHFPGSVGELDYYHASEHLWELAHTLHKNEEDAKNWVVPLLKNLKYRGGEELFSVLEGLLKTAAEKKMSAEQQKVLNREVAYFRSHESRLDYPQAKRLGIPLGSGSMESACSQLQGRFKRTGQFWSRAGERNLLALEIASRNNDWNELWAQSA